MSRLVTLMVAAYALPACAVRTLYLGTSRVSRVQA